MDLLGNHRLMMVTEEQRKKGGQSEVNRIRRGIENEIRCVETGNNMIKSDRKWALTDVFVGEFVGQADPLGLMLHRPAVHDRGLELGDDGLVNGIALHE